MKNNKRKGFTLVELLVVIAILAILATVSVIGYTAFIKKANQSNAVVELTQIRDAVNSAVLDGTETVVVDDATTVVFTYSDEKLTAKVNDEDVTADDADKIEQIEKAILTLAEIKLADGQNFAATIDEANKNITTVVYTYSKGVTATWNLANGNVAN